MRNAFLSQAKSLLFKEYGGTKGNLIYTSACKRFIEIVNENINEDKAMYMHTRAKIYPCIAILDAFIENGYAKEEALKFITSFTQQRSHTYAKIIRNFMKIPFIYKKMPKTFGNMTKKNFGEKQNFSANFYEISDRVMRFDMTKCPYSDILTKYGYPEITIAFCRGDDIVYGKMHPKLIWERTKTLGDGDSICDFKITRID